jgi:hypothetical protein
MQLRVGLGSQMLVRCPGSQQSSKSTPVTLARMRATAHLSVCSVIMWVNVVALQVLGSAEAVQLSRQQ